MVPMTLVELIDREEGCYRSTWRTNMVLSEIIIVTRTPSMLPGNRHPPLPNNIIIVIHDVLLDIRIGSI
jgi:hypothetical protein